MAMTRVWYIYIYILLSPFWRFLLYHSWKRYAFSFNHYTFLLHQHIIELPRVGQKKETPAITTNLKLDSMEWKRYLRMMWCETNRLVLNNTSNILWIIDIWRCFQYLITQFVFYEFHWTYFNLFFFHQFFSLFIHFILNLNLNFKAYCIWLLAFV